MVLALRPGHDFERSPHGFCHGWQNGSPGTLKSGSRVGMGSVLVFSRSAAGETQLFPIGIMDSATSGVRPFIFFDPLIFKFFQGAAAAAAGRGSPPPPRAGVGAQLGQDREEDARIIGRIPCIRVGAGIAPGASGGLWGVLARCRRLPPVLAIGLARGRLA